VYFSLLFNQLIKILGCWCVGAGGYVGEGKHFPALRSEVGEAEPVPAKAGIVHISTGTKPAKDAELALLDFLTAFAAIWLHQLGLLRRIP
jgi:hypothetical protein